MRVVTLSSSLLCDIHTWIGWVLTIVTVHLELIWSMVVNYVDNRCTWTLQLSDVHSYHNVTKQLLDEVEHDIMNYQNRGLGYLPKPKAEADNTDTRF